MPLLTPEECLLHCRAEAEDAPILADLLDEAESAVSGYLNRAIFASEADLAFALSALPADAGAAQDAYDAAMVAAAQLSNAAARRMAEAVASERLASATLRFQRVMHGMVVVPRVVAAVRLTLGTLYANREGVVIGVSAVKLPQGVDELLRPDRKVMMP